jgi:hypothetical protein
LVTPGITFANLTYVVGCTIVGPTRATVVGPIANTSTTTFTVASYALSAMATGKGTLFCLWHD